jgi:hypothetical protein
MNEKKSLLGPFCLSIQLAHPNPIHFFRIFQFFSNGEVKRRKGTTTAENICLLKSLIHPKVQGNILGALKRAFLKGKRMDGFGAYFLYKKWM